jgi:hypothetical protein
VVRGVAELDDEESAEPELDDEDELDGGGPDATDVVEVDA